MAKYNTNASKIEKALAEIKHKLSRTAQVIPQSKWDQMRLELSKYKRRSRIKNSLFIVSVIMNIVLLYLQNK